MKLNEYIKQLQVLYETYGNLDLIYSSDDEGNRYDTVKYLPNYVNFLIDEKEIINEDDLDGYELEDITQVICVN